MRFTVTMLALVMLPSWSAAQVRFRATTPPSLSGGRGPSTICRTTTVGDGNLYLGVGGGHYWTDHLKTDIEAGWSSPANSETYSDYTAGGLQTFAISNYRVRDIQLAIGQSYQFGRNDWVHPYLGRRHRHCSTPDQARSSRQSRIAYNTTSRVLR